MKALSIQTAFVALLIGLASCKKAADDPKPDSTGSTNGPILPASSGFETLGTIKRHSGLGINVFNTISALALADAGNGKVGILEEESYQLQQSTIYQRFKAVYTPGADSIAWAPFTIPQKQISQSSQNIELAYGFVPGTDRAWQSYFYSTSSGGFSNFEVALKAESAPGQAEINFLSTDNNPDWYGMPDLLSPTEVLMSGTKAGSSMINGNFTNSYAYYQDLTGGPAKKRYVLRYSYYGQGYTSGHKAFVIGGGKVYGMLQNNSDSLLIIDLLGDNAQTPFTRLAARDSAGVGVVTRTMAQVDGGKVILNVFSKRAGKDVVSAFTWQEGQTTLTTLYTGKALPDALTDLSKPDAQGRLYGVLSTENGPQLVRIGNAGTELLGKTNKGVYGYSKPTPIGSYVYMLVAPFQTGTGVKNQADLVRIAQ